MFNILIKNFKIIILLIFILSFSLNSQDKEPEAFRFYIPPNITNSPLDSNLQQFKYDDFWIGWFWGGHCKLAEAMYMNGNHNFDGPGGYSYFSDKYYNYVPSKKLKAVAAFVDDQYPHQAKSLQYEPTLLIEDGLKFNRYADKSNPIWGFKSIKGEILSNPADINYSRLILKSTDTSITNNPSYPVLAQPWVSDELGYHLEFTKELTDVYDTNRSGHYFYLSINLRRLDTLNTDTSFQNVLKALW
jgi:hypothetical protein